MKIFKESFNPMLKKLEWQLEDEDYDFKIDIARAAYADMLHDRERNVKYYEAIAEAVRQTKQQGKIARVLDIGTGTGLLSMMAAKSGADIITACEAFQPMAECAINVIKDNNLMNKIKVICKHSSELTVGKNKDLEEKANILVTELFDTELIGEGALNAYIHALKNLIESDCICVPHAATVYAQVAYSELIQNWNTLKPLSFEKGKTIFIPSKFSECTGFPSIHDVQLNQLALSDFTPFSDPIPIFNFTFNKIETLTLKQKKAFLIKAKSSGLFNGIFMWWTLSMNQSGKNILNCGPYWANNNTEWRDHWMQAIYYIPPTLSLLIEENFILKAFHDEYSIWFDVKKYEEFDNPNEQILRPICNCNMHIGFTRNRLATLNDSKHVIFFKNVLKKYITENTNVLCVSEGSWLPFIAYILGARKIYFIEDEICRKYTFKDIIKFNKLEEKVILIPKNYDEINLSDFDNEPIDVVIGEPYFMNSILPWDNFFFWFFCAKIHADLLKKAKILPCKASLYAIGVSFTDLHKIRAPVYECEGFKMDAFDGIIQKAIEDCDEFVEPHNLWEYPSIAITKVFKLATINYDTIQNFKDFAASGDEPFLTLDHKCNGIVIWTAYCFDEEILSHGPKDPVIPGEKILWDIHARPGIYFISPKDLTYSDKLSWNLLFVPKNGTLHLNFNVISSNKIEI